jgi:hypothetical protein
MGLFKILTFPFARGRFATSQNGFVISIIDFAISQNDFVMCRTGFAMSQRAFVILQSRFVISRNVVAMSQGGLVTSQNVSAISSNAFAILQSHFARSPKGLAISRNVFPISGNGKRTLGKQQFQLPADEKISDFNFSILLVIRINISNNLIIANELARRLLFSPLLVLKTNTNKQKQMQ